MKRFSSLHDLICALPQRAEKPAIIALQKEGLDVWSYRKLSDHVVRLAAGLTEAGLRRGERVAILAGNNPEWVVACLEQGWARFDAIFWPNATTEKKDGATAR